MRLLISEEVEISFDFDYSIEAKRAIETALSAEGFPRKAEVSLTLTGEEEIRELNRDHRGIDSVTDVLSFPMLDISQPSEWDEAQLDEVTDPDSGAALIGDIVLCVPRVVSQAAEYGHSVLREYAFLIVHSALHLLGYDHIDEADRELMENRQRIIMEKLEIMR